MKRIAIAMLTALASAGLSAASVSYTEKDNLTGESQVVTNVDLSGLATVEYVTDEVAKAKPGDYNAVRAQVATNTANIETNTALIAANAANIETKAGAIKYVGTNSYELADCDWICDWDGTVMSGTLGDVWRSLSNGGDMEYFF